MPKRLREEPEAELPAPRRSKRVRTTNERADSEDAPLRRSERLRSAAAAAVQPKQPAKRPVRSQAAALTQKRAPAKKAATGSGKKGGRASATKTAAPKAKIAKNAATKKAATKKPAVASTRKNAPAAQVQARPVTIATKKFAALTRRKGRGVRAAQPATAGARIPVEILHEIFKFALPSDNLLNPSLHLGPNSPWCNATRLKLAIVSVCKVWQEVGTPYLYHNIAIRRVHMIEGLLDTLTSAPELGELVHAINFLCYVPSNYFDSVGPDMYQIFARCPSLVDLELSWPFDLRKPVPRDQDEDTASDAEDNDSDDARGDRGVFSYWTFPLPSTALTSFKLGETFHFPRLLQECSGSLQELSIISVDHKSFDVEISFPCLRTLNVTLAEGDPDGTFASKWHMPEVRRLTLSTFCDVTSTETVLDWAKHILGLLGPQLQYLAFPGQYSRVTRATQDLEDVGYLLRMCPSIEHLVLSAHHVVSNDEDGFPNVKFLDMWRSNVHVWDDPTATPLSPSRTFVSVPEFLDFEELAHFPNLEHVRLLDTVLFFLVSDVPRTFDCDERTEWHFTFPGLSIRQISLDRATPISIPEGDAVFLPCDVSVIRSTDMQAVQTWAGTIFGTAEMQRVNNEQQEFKDVVHSGKHVARDPELARHMAALDAPSIADVRMMGEFGRMMGRSATWGYNQPGGSDDEGRDPTAFNNRLQYYPDSDDDGEEESCWSAESEDEDMPLRDRKHLCALYESK
ncbi:hypothetical protein B0H16DRAFT_347549 [Mycena metata]|uniref:F-box domain-containing protein n=1 Tax=Mycena metata TaxID=1033252 RepID=A0AAD7HK57_9AGAR|nr:hypothetical protein B0H16DRAFT_347549 [Mycena metata]